MKEENPYIDVTDVPELAEPESKVFVQIECECAYSLKGSSQRCDVDQTLEKMSVVGTDSAAAVCRRGHSLCSTVCPADLL